MTSLSGSSLRLLTALVAGLLLACGANAQATFFDSAQDFADAWIDLDESNATDHFILDAVNVSLADEVAAPPSNGELLCGPVLEAPCKITWSQNPWGYSVQLRALEMNPAGRVPGAMYANLVYEESGARRAPTSNGLSIGERGLFQGDDFDLTFSAGDTHAFGMWIEGAVGQGAGRGVPPTSDAVLVFSGATLLGTLDIGDFAGGSEFVGVISSTPITRIQVLDGLDPDDTVVQSFVVGVEPIDVTTFEDENNEDGDCSIREAIDAARYDMAVDDCRAGALYGDIIRLEDGTYVVAGQLYIDGAMSIVGRGADETFIDGHGSGSVFFIDGTGPVPFRDPGAEGSLLLKDLTIENGSAYEGGGILNYGEVYTNNVVIRNNEALVGGGIANHGYIDLYWTTVESNVATVEMMGKGPPGRESLGGVFVRGGGIASFASFYALESIVRDNQVLMLEAFTEGQAEGGGIYMEGDSLNNMLDAVSITGNAARASSFVANTFARGGGVFVRGMEQYHLHLTISGNQAIGQNSSLGIGGGWFATKDGTDPPPVDSRGCCEEPSYAAGIEMSTLFDNSASTAGGGVFGESYLYGSIVVKNAAASGDNCAGGVWDYGSVNMFETGEVDCPADDSDVFVTAPDYYLGALDDNGGYPETHRLLEGSPAINAAAGFDRVVGGCFGRDGRGFPRSNGAVCDVGAYEITENIAVDKWQDGPAVPGSRVTHYIDVYNPGYFMASVDVTDLVPESLSNCAWTCERHVAEEEEKRGLATTCGESGVGDIHDSAMIAGGEGALYELTCDLAPETLGVLINEASAVSDLVDPDLENNVGVSEESVAPMADLEIDQDSPEVIFIGEGAVFEVVVTNNGPSDATSVELWDPVAVGLFLDSVECGLEERLDERRSRSAGLCFLPSLEAGESHTFFVTFDADGTPGNDGDFTLSVESATTDPVSENDSVSGSIPINLHLRDDWESGDTSAWDDF